MTPDRRYMETGRDFPRPARRWRQVIVLTFACIALAVIGAAPATPLG